MMNVSKLERLLDRPLRFLSPGLLPTWLLAFALARAVQVVLYIPGSVWLVLALTGVAVLIISLVLHNKYAAITFGAILLIGIFWAFVPNKGQLGKEWLTIGDWFLRYCSGLESLEDGFGPECLRAVCILVGVVTALFGVRRVFFPGQLAVSCGLLLMLWLMGHTEILSLAVLAFVALGVNFAVSFGEFSRKKQGPGGHQHVIVLWTLPILAIAFLLGYWAIAETTTFPRSNWLGTRLDVVNDYLSQYTGLVKEQTDGFSLAKVGFSPLGNRLGGPAHPIQSNAFYVGAPRSMLLRGAVYDTYTGNNWIKGEAVVQHRLGTQENLKLQQKTFDIGLPPKEQVPSSFYYDAQVTIYPEYANTSTLFVPLRLYQAAPTEAMTMLVYFNTYGEVYASRMVQRKQNYSSSSMLPNYTHRNFSRWVADYQKTHKDACVVDPVLAVQYTALPEDLPEGIAALAEEITKDETTTYDKAHALMMYLATECIYSMEPEMPPMNMDFVEHFLDTKTGYCTYYASAMAVLGRCVGLPTRYVEGFRMPDAPPEGNTLYLVRFENAHAWCEVYLEGIGWIPFDPLSVDTSEPEENLQPSLPEPTMDISQFQNQTPEVSVPPRIEVLAEEEGTPAWVWFTVGGLIFVAVITGLVILIEKRTRSQRLFRKTPLGQIQRHYMDILHLLTYYNADMKPGETLYMYALRIDKWLYMENSPRMRDLIQILVKVCYGRHVPTQAEAARFRLFVKKLRKYTRKNMPVFYVWHYVLNIPYHRPKYS